MKMNKICPEFRAAMLRHSGFIDYEGDRWQGCIGSDCAKWHRVYWGGETEEDVFPERGNCIDNSYADAWEDPAFRPK